MAVTLAQLILDCEDMLYGSAQVERPAEDTMVKAVAAAADVAWRMAAPSMWRRGDLAEYWPAAGTVGEIAVMAENHEQSTDVTVRRGQRQTTAAASYAVGDVFRKNPAFPRAKIERVIYQVVDSQLWPHIWYRSKRSLAYSTDAGYWPLNAADFDVEEVYQIDLTGQAVGSCTFANATDRWTCTAHGLAVGDHVRFTAAGSATPAEYAADTDYWVLAVPTADTFTLASTAAGATAVDGLADSTADWTLEKRLRSWHPFPRAWWDPVTDTSATSTGRILRIRQVHDPAQTVFYTAKTKPLSSAVTSIPDSMADMIPWGVCWMLLGGTRSAARRHDPRARREGENESQVFADASFFRQTFERMRGDYQRQLYKEKKPQPNWIPATPRSF